MLIANFSTRTIANRAYYSMFYALLALLFKAGMDIKMSKHYRLISLFDQEFVKQTTFEKRYSTMLHDNFDLRQDGDYKDMIQIPREKAKQAVRNAREFLGVIKNFIRR